MPARRLSPAALLAVLLASAPAGARADECQGRLSGAVQGAFDCTVAMGKGGSGRVSFAVTAAASPAGVRSLAPGAVEFRGPLGTRSYASRDLDRGKASLTTSAGTRFTFKAGKGGKGEATLDVAQAERYAQLRGRYVVNGSYQARLVPEKGAAGEVVVAVQFTVTTDVIE